MVREEIADRIRIWAIHLTLSQRTGLTLWADVNGRDTLLADDGRILIAEDAVVLRRFVVCDARSNLSTLETYLQLRSILEKVPEMADARASAYYDFCSMTQALSHSDWGVWSLDACSTVLDCLNLLWDAAVTLENDSVISVMDGRSGLGELMNILTFINEEELFRLRLLNQDSVRADAFAALSWFESVLQPIGEGLQLTH
jgi:hypothetical protein